MAKTTELAYATIAELSQRLAAGELSPVELTEAALARAEALEPKLNAWITLLPEAALAEARQAEQELARGEPRGPLHGIPLGIKDLFWTRGVRTTAASKIMADFVPDQDAAVVERLRAAGSVILGKTNLVEFAYGPTDYCHPEYGPARNPWDLERFPGGSSSGSGAAVAAGVVPAAMGSDTGGSIRNPASFCGLSGLKPTYGLVSCYGAVPLAPTLDHMGPLAHSAEDCALLLQALAGHDPRDPQSKRQGRREYSAGLDQGAAGLRIGIPRALFFEPDLPDEIRAAVDQAAATFERLGAACREVELPGLTQDAEQVMTILRVEASQVHRAALAARPHDFVPDIRQKLLDGLKISGVDYVEAEQARRRVRWTLAAALQEVDLLLTPTRDTTAPRQAPDGRILDAYPHVLAGRVAPTFPFNAAGLPAISIPCGIDRLRLPIGLHLAARGGEDGLVLRAAHAYQQATDWHRRRPAIEP